MGRFPVPRSFLPRMMLALGSFLAVLLLLETSFFILRSVRKWTAPDEGPSRFEWCGDCPEIYRNNPSHPEFDELGLRDCGAEDRSGSGVPAPRRVVLVLGDSVAYGYGVLCREAFPFLLEQALDDSRPSVRVGNAGVPGYTTYNELQLYRRIGPVLQPELVLLTVVLNDVANPRLHWAEGGRRAVDVPPAAIPNPDYDRVHAQPALARWQKEESRRRFLVGRAWSALSEGIRRWKERGRKEGPLPDLITGEDTLRLSVLEDGQSPESRWLRGMMAELKGEVSAGGGKLAVMIVPLSYQMNPEYPTAAQATIAGICRDLALPSLDLLPVFRQRGGNRLFLRTLQGTEDYWHLSPEGHAVAADALKEFLLERGLLGSTAIPVPH